MNRFQVELATELVNGRVTKTQQLEVADLEQALSDPRITFACVIDGCGRQWPAQDMRNLNVRQMDGRIVPVCGGCGQLLRKDRIPTFPLTQTLERALNRIKLEQRRVRGVTELVQRLGAGENGDTLRKVVPIKRSA